VKKVRIIVFAMLVAIIVSLTVRLVDHKEAMTSKNREINEIRLQLKDADLANKEKDQYIAELHSSVDSLTENVKSLEEKLKELTIFQDKLK
jgi:cell division protein FtsL